MHKSCALRSGSNSRTDPSRSDITLGRLKSWREKVQNVLVISANNPISAKYFRSEISIRKEKERQLNSKHPWVIHPLSKFRAWYEVFLVFVYLSNLAAKPIDAAFAGRKTLFRGHRLLSITLDMLCWIDIYMNFRTGFIRESWRQVEMDPKKIARNYVLGPFFILDTLSSLPRNIPYFFWKKPPKPLLGVINIFLTLKFLRITTLLYLVFRLSQYFEIDKSKRHVFFFSSVLLTMVLIHWLACIQYIVPRLTGRYFQEIPFEESWIYQDGLYKLNFQKKYRHAFFKASAEILGIRLNLYKMTINVDLIISMITYIVGKVLMTSIWVVLACAILDSRSMEIKFNTIMNQLMEYMEQKGLPFKLRNRLSQYYTFKYQKKYLKEENITSLLSESLTKEVNVHLCKTLISNVSIFSDMTADQLNVLVAKLTPEIYLPRDTIVQSGNTADSMFFISSGTVAVYTHSGKEICHLQEGAYFGEVGLVFRDQSSICTIIAIEITQVYRLKRRDFNQTLKKNKVIFSNILQHAEILMKTVLQAEEIYKRELFEKSFRVNSETKAAPAINDA